MGLYEIETVRTEHRKYAIEAASLDDAETMALEGYDEPTEIKVYDEYVHRSREVEKADMVDGGPGGIPLEQDE